MTMFIIKCCVHRVVRLTVIACDCIYLGIWWKKDNKRHEEIRYPKGANGYCLLYKSLPHMAKERSTLYDNGFYYLVFGICGPWPKSILWL